MKKVEYEFGCRALGYSTLIEYVPDEMTKEEIKEMVEDKIGWYVGIDIEEGYEEDTEIVYRKSR